MGNYHHPEIETMPREDIEALQSARLVEAVERVYNTVPAYRKKMEALGVEPRHIKGIEDLHLLPFITKDDLREEYPYGFLGVPLDEVAASMKPRVVATSVNNLVEEYFSTHSNLDSHIEGRITILD